MSFKEGPLAFKFLMFVATKSSKKDNNLENNKIKSWCLIDWTHKIFSRLNSLLNYSIISFLFDILSDSLLWDGSLVGKYSCGGWQVDAALDLSHTQNIGRMIKTHFPHSQVWIWLFSFQFLSPLCFELKLLYQRNKG